jgi:hypothetical protein
MGPARPGPDASAFLIFYGVRRALLISYGSGVPNQNGVVFPIRWK